MDFGTTISPYRIERDDRPIAKPQQPSHATSANTMTDSFVKSELPSATTNLLPEIILGSWGPIVRGTMSVRMYGDLVRLAS
jgi:hypothetical protein